MVIIGIEHRTVYQLTGVIDHNRSALRRLFVRSLVLNFIIKTPAVIFSINIVIGYIILQRNRIPFRNSYINIHTGTAAFILAGNGSGQYSSGQNSIQYGFHHHQFKKSKRKFMLFQSDSAPESVNIT
ncbi:hypothetical protein D3C87_1569340 [compost metagenome]